MPVGNTPARMLGVRLIGLHNFLSGFMMYLAPDLTAQMYQPLFSMLRPGKVALPSEGYGMSFAVMVSAIGAILMAASISAKVVDLYVYVRFVPAALFAAAVFDGRLPYFFLFFAVYDAGLALGLLAFTDPAKQQKHKRS